MNAPLTVDQRDVPRPASSACDIGAFEYGAVPPTTSTSTSTSTSTTVIETTTTTLPCTRARCIVEAAETTGACAGQTIPASVTARFTQAETLIEQAAMSPAKKAANLRKKARKAFKQAGAKATRAAKGKRPKLTAGCAMALKDAAARVAAEL